MHLVHMPTLTFAGIVFNFLFIVSSGCYGQYIHDLNLRCYIIIFGELMFFFSLHIRWTSNGPLRAKYNEKMGGMNAPIAKPKGSKKLKDWENK